MRIQVLQSIYSRLQVLLLVIVLYSVSTNKKIINYSNNKLIKTFVFLHISDSAGGIKTPQRQRRVLCDDG